MGFYFISYFMNNVFNWSFEIVDQKISQVLLVHLGTTMALSFDMKTIGFKTSLSEGLIHKVRNKIK